MNPTYGKVPTARPRTTQRGELETQAFCGRIESNYSELGVACFGKDTEKVVNLFKKRLQDFWGRNFRRGSSTEGSPRARCSNSLAQIESR